MPQLVGVQRAFGAGRLLSEGERTLWRGPSNFVFVPKGDMRPFTTFLSTLPTLDKEISHRLRFPNQDENAATGEFHP